MLGKAAISLCKTLSLPSFWLLLPETNFKHKVTSVSKKLWQYWHCHCDSIMNFLANSYFIFQISCAKTFKIRYTRCQHNNLIKRYSYNYWKIMFHRFISFCQFHVTCKKPETEKFVFYIIAFDPINS
jgi:hypothetical protein